MERVNQILAKANEYKESFNKYAYLWVDDRKEFMRQFLLYNHVLTQEEIEAHAETGVPESPPTLEQFKAQVDQYEKTYEDVSKIDDIRLIDKWFRIDSKPFKTALLNTIKKWSFMFKQHLMDDVTNSLKDLDEFIKEKDKHLVKEVKEGDYEHLISMMGHLGAIREKTNTYDNMFDPIKKKIELLKTYGQEVPDDVYERLQVIYIEFNSCY
jgi:dynein heavy chain